MDVYPTEEGRLRKLSPDISTAIMWKKFYIGFQSSLRAELHLMNSTYREKGFYVSNKRFSSNWMGLFKKRCYHMIFVFLRLTALTMAISRSIQVAADGTISFFFVDE